MLWRPKDVREESSADLVPEDLLERCRNGDEQAWKELVQATNRQVYTLCLRILADPDDAAEATQETYIKVWRGLRGFRGEAQFTTWLHRIATNTAISKLRSKKRRSAREIDVDQQKLEASIVAPSTEERAETLLDFQRLTQELARLPEHYRVPLVLRDVYGLGIEEIAKRLKISETAAKVRVHRARKKLKDMVYPDSVDQG